MQKLAMLVPLLSLVLGGCIRIEQRLVLNADASGTLDVTYSVPDETSQRIKAMINLANELSTAGGDAPTAPAEDDLTRLIFDPEESALRNWIQSYASYGIHLDELEVQARNARREVKFTLRFDNIAQVAKADWFARYGFSLAKTSDGQYMLYTRAATQEALDPAWAADRQDDYLMLAPLLSGFYFALEIRPPGTVLKASAPDRLSPYVVTWIYDFDVNHMALANLQRKPMTLVFNSDGLNLPEFQQPTPQETPAAVNRPQTNAVATAPPVTEHL